MSIHQLQNWKNLFNQIRLLRNQVNPDDINTFLTNNPEFDIDIRFHPLQNANALELALACLNPVITARLLELGADFSLSLASKYIGFLARDQIRHPSLAEDEFQQRKMELAEVILTRVHVIVQELHKQNYTFEDAFTAAANRNDIPFLRLLIRYGTNPNRNKIVLEVGSLTLETLQFLLLQGMDPIISRAGQPNKSLFQQSIQLSKIEFIEAIKQSMSMDKFELAVNGELSTLLSSPFNHQTSKFIIKMIDEYHLDPHATYPNRQIREKVYYIRFCLWLVTLDLDHFVTMDIARTLCFTNPMSL